MDKISNFISEPDYHYPGHNHFLFGVYSTNDKETALKYTNSLVHIFLQKKIEDIERTQILVGVSPVIWINNDNLFVATDNAIFKETDIDGRFLFILMPISPKIAIALSKTAYYASQITLSHTLKRLGDMQLSMSTKDANLINNYEHKSVIYLPFKEGKPKNIPSYNVKNNEILKIVCTMINDAEELVFSDKDDKFILENLKTKNESRKIEIW